jgi:hypothetical protein
LPLSSINAINSYCDSNQNYQTTTNKYQKNKDELPLSTEISNKINLDNNIPFNINRKYLDKNIIIYQPIMANIEENCQHSKPLTTELQPQTMLNMDSAASLNHANFVQSNHMTHNIPNSSFEDYTIHSLRNHDNFKLNFKQEPDTDMPFTT